jgi:hypothetical protein
VAGAKGAPVGGDGGKVDFENGGRSRRHGLGMADFYALVTGEAPSSRVCHARAGGQPRRSVWLKPPEQFDRRSARHDQIIGRDGETASSTEQGHVYRNGISRYGIGEHSAAHRVAGAGKISTKETRLCEADDVILSQCLASFAVGFSDLDPFLHLRDCLSD